MLKTVGSTLILFVATVILCPTSSTSQTGTEAEEFAYAERLFSDQMYDLAALQFDKFAEQYPSSPKAPQALLEASKAYSRAGQPNEAVRAGRTAVLRYPESAFLDQTLMQQAEAHLSLRQFRDAAQAFERIAIFVPDSPLAAEGLLKAARAYWSDGDGAKSEECLYVIFEKYPGSTIRDEVRVELASLLLANGQLSRALNEIEKVTHGQIKDALGAKAFLVKAEILEKMGRLLEAQRTYEQIAETMQDPVAAGQSAFRLGQILSDRANYEEANRYLDKAAALLNDKTDQAKCFMGKGTTFLEMDLNKDALTAFEQASTLSQSDSLRAEALFGAGLAAMRLAQFEAALGHFDAVLTLQPTEEDVSGRTQAAATVGAMRCLTHLGRFADAQNRGKAYAQHHASSPYLDQVLFESAGLSKLGEGCSRHTIQAYLGFLAQFPGSRFADDALFAVARCYEAQEKYADAVEAYEDYMLNYPAGDEYDNAARRAHLLGTFLVRDEERALSRLGGQLAEMASGDAGPDVKRNLAEIYLEDLRDFQKALHLYSDIMSTLDEAYLSSGIMLGIARSYHGLAATSYLLRPSDEETSAYGDSAATYYRSAIERPASDAVQANAVRGLWELRLLSTRTVSDRIDWLTEIDDLFERVNVGPQAQAELLVETGELILNNIAEGFRDSLLVVAKGLLDKASRLQATAETRARAMFSSANASLAAGDTSTANKTLSELLRLFPKTNAAVQGMLLSARINATSGDVEAAKRTYSTLRREYHYSSVADTATARLVEILLRLKEYDQARELLLENESKPDTDLLSPDGSVIQGSACSDSEFLLAEVYKNLGKYSEAEEFYLRFIRRGKGPAHIANAYFALAEMATLGGEAERAIGFLQEVHKLVGIPDSLNFLAWTRTGDLLYERTDYAEALEEYRRALASKQEGRMRQHAWARTVLCLYKLDRLTAAEAEAKGFAKEFKEDGSSRALFAYEKGEYYLRQKDFKNAEKAFKSASKDFKGAPTAPWGDLGLGKLYMVMNKTEDALEILTEIPSKYPDNELAATAYLNLGDFYYKSRQLENTLLAFDNAVKHPKVTRSVRAAALRYLIRCCDELRLWDRAIVLAHQYLEEYPDSEDAFSKRTQIGIFLMQLKEYDRAISHLKSLKRQADSESEAEIQFWIGKCYAEMGRYEEAIVEYMKVKYLSAPSKLPWDVTAMYESGMAYMKLEELEKAKRIFERIVRERGSESNFGRVAREKIDEIEKRLPGIQG